MPSRGVNLGLGIGLGAAAAAAPDDAAAAARAARLAPAAEAAREKAREEMMGQLKQVGNSLLGMVGLSLDDFAAVKDEATGSYSIQFGRKQEGERDA